MSEIGDSSGSSDNQDADIIAIGSARKTQTHKKKKITEIKQAFEKYFPLSKPKKTTKKTNKKKKR